MRKRSISQNDKFHAMIRDFAIWGRRNGYSLSVEEWKWAILQANGFKVRQVETPFGAMFMMPKSSFLTTGEMEDLITWMYAEGNERFVEWSENYWE